MEIKVIEESGYYSALYGLGLSKGLTTHLTFDEFKENEKLVARLHKVATKLTPKDKGHNKFLESLNITILCDMTRYWWSEADTYRLSTKQSESTMHKQKVRYQDYKAKSEKERVYIQKLITLQIESAILFAEMKDSNIELAKASIMESMLQKRQWAMDYKCLKNILSQRENHKLKLSWVETFCKSVLEQVRYPEFLRFE